MGRAGAGARAMAGTNGKGSFPVSTCRIRPTRERGWIATANQDNLPRGYPHAVGFQWTDPFRFARIEEVLGSGRRFTLADMMQLQQDELSLPARCTRAAGPRAETGRASGRGRPSTGCGTWDFVLNQGSVPAAIYVTWEKAGAPRRLGARGSPRRA